jgi:hypothetical protein
MDPGHWTLVAGPWPLNPRLLYEPWPLDSDHHHGSSVLFYMNSHSWSAWEAEGGCVQIQHIYMSGVLAKNCNNAKI